MNVQCAGLLYEGMCEIYTGQYIYIYIYIYIQYIYLHIHTQTDTYSSIYISLYI